MGIDLIWRDQHGSMIDSVGDSEFHLSHVVAQVREDRATPFTMLKNIDPYGTTRFTPPQVTRLLRELESLRARTTDPAISITLGRFLSVIRAAEGTAKTWLEFAGD